MKKIIALTLATLMIICCFASCGKDAGNTPSDNAGADNSPVLVDFSPQYEDVHKGYINHTTAGEYSITEDEAFECTDDFYISLSKGSVISSDKEFGIHAYVVDETETFVLNTNVMTRSGFEMDGFNPKMKTGEIELAANCFVRISVKGSLADVKIKYPEDSVPIVGDKSVVGMGKKISVVNEFFSTKGDSVNYIFITDLHNGAFINDNDGDGLRDYDSAETVKQRLESKTKVLAQAVAIVNASPYLDFIVAGGDFINGYETTESLTYKEAKKKNPKLTVREHAIDQIQEILEPLKKCKKPVLILAGNHDDNAGHSLWQTSNHPGETSTFPEFLISDLDWEKEVLSEFLNVDVVRDDSYSYGGKSISKYYYYDLKKGEKTVRIICLDYDDVRYPFNASGAVTSAKGKGGAYYAEQMKWFAEVALHGDFDECILLSHAPSTASPVLDKIVQSYHNRVSYKNPGVNIDTTFSSRTSGNVTHYHHGHEHEEFVLYSNALKYWTISTSTVSEFDIIAATPDSVYKYHYATKKETELKREGGKQ